MSGRCSEVKEEYPSSDASKICLCKYLTLKLDLVPRGV